MSKYSVAGYVASLRMRSKRTLLVEGPTDRKILAALLGRWKSTGGPSLVIDTAEILRGPAGGEGNRELVEMVHSASLTAGARVWCFVDREFRCASLRPPVDELCSHQELPGGMYWTRGHSIECYLLRKQYVLRFLRMMWSELLVEEFFEALEQLFEGILAEAAAFGLGAAVGNCIGRSTGVLAPNAWVVTSDRVEIDFKRIEQVLLDRGLSSESISVMSLVRDEVRPCLLADQELSRWLCHGHLGWESLWTCVAQIASSFGVEAKAVEEIAYGHQDYKQRALTDSWADSAKVAGDVAPESLVLALLS